ncbi:MAG: hypothetical protein V5A18_08655 [Haloarculaceae archaeon]
MDYAFLGYLVVLLLAPLAVTSVAGAAAILADVEALLCIRAVVRLGDAADSPPTSLTRSLPRLLVPYLPDPLPAS